MTQTEFSFDRNFDTLLVDSIDFLFEAISRPPYNEEGNSMSRASMMFSFLLLENVANICIEYLDLERTIHREIDRLPILGKFDFYLRVSFENKQLERGVRQIQLVKDLIRLRNSLVHLKSQEVEWLMDPIESSARIIGCPTKKIPTLSIATNPKYWDSGDAVKVASKVHAFLLYFFKEKCMYTPSKVSSLLFSESKNPGNENYVMPHMFEETNKRLMKLDIDLSYMELPWTE